MHVLPFDKNKLIKICRQNDVRSISLFGSISRGEETAESDIDLLDVIKKDKSLLKLIRLERELSQVLGHPVDLLTQAAISPYLREKILQEKTVLYEAG